MSTLLLISSLFAAIGLWVMACRIDCETSWAHIVATVLMSAGAVVMLAWSIGAPFITATWIINGVSALMSGVAVWIAFDRRWKT